VIPILDLTVPTLLQFLVIRVVNAHKFMYTVCHLAHMCKTRNTPPHHLLTMTCLGR